MSIAHTAGQRGSPRLKATHGKENGKDAGGADPETGAVPFPQQKAKGRISSAECGWHHEAWNFYALVP